MTGPGNYVMSTELLKLIQKYDVQGPRYTSYPTVPHWSSTFGQSEFKTTLESFDRNTIRPLSLYTHIPFCEEKCYYCACNVIITRHKEQADLYLGYLKKELDLVSPSVPKTYSVTQIHWGGGTPTYLSAKQIEMLFQEYEKRFSISATAEISIEVDPRVTTFEQLKTLRTLGFNRISMGVQDFDPKVQLSINRNQTEEQTIQVHTWCQELGFTSINMDFVYGLPFQTREGFEKNLKMIVALEPDRIAFYNYAHVPWQVPYQKFIPEHSLPTAELKLELFQLALEIFKDRGYLPIGLDHFAKMDDGLVKAFEHKTLRRNFMGYTTQKNTLLLAFGVSSISDVETIYAQNFRKLSDYYKALDEKRWPVMRGCVLSLDDQLRREIIMNLMCYLEASIPEMEKKFSTELKQLEPMVSEGFLTRSPDRLQVTELGRMFVRNICMVFDAYFQRQQEPSKRYSRTV